MLVHDTDHLTEYQRGTSPEAHRLKQRLDLATEIYATTIVTVEEIVRGWMAAIRRVAEPRRQISAYARLQQLFRFFATWNVLPWSEAAADVYDSLRRAKIRVGTMDLKIASIALASDAPSCSQWASQTQPLSWWMCSEHLPSNVSLAI